MATVESGGKARRNRTSYVCLACRKRKSRCDRGKPCSKCVALKTECIYLVDAESPASSGRVSKINAEERTDNKMLLDKILELEKQLSFWKSKAQSYAQSLGSVASTASTEMMISNNNANFQVCNIENTVKIGSQLRVELDDHETTYMLSKSSKSIIPPFGFITLIFRDFNLFTMFSSVYGFTYSDIIGLVGDKDITMQDIFIYAAASKNKEERPLPCFLEGFLMQYLKRFKNQASFNTVNIPVVFFANNDKLEHFAFEEFPEFLKSLIEQMQNAISPNESLFNFHLKHFLEHIYPLYPFLEVSSFLREIRRLVSYNGCTLPSNVNQKDRPSIKINKKSLRSDFEKLALLMVILQLTHDSLETLENTEIIKKFKLLGEPNYCNSDDKWLAFSHQILFILNYTRFPSEDIFCCQLYQRICNHFSSRESFVLSDRQPVAQLGRLIQSACILGLHKDPSYYKRIMDSFLSPQEIFNYRRKLWLGLCTLIYQQSVPVGYGGGLEQYNPAFFLNIPETAYMEFVTKDLGETNNFDFQMLNLLVEKHQLGSIMISLNNACTSIPPAPVSVVIKLITTLELELPKFFSSKIDSDDKLNEISLPFEDVFINISQVRTCDAFLMRMVSESLVLNITWSLFLKLDSKARSEPLVYSTLYEQMFERTILSCFEMTNFIIKALNNEFEKNLSVSFYYCLNKQIQQNVLRIFLCLTSLLLKLKLLIRNSENELKNGNPILISSSQLSIQRKLPHIKQLSIILEALLKSLAEAFRGSEFASKLEIFNTTRFLLDYMIQIVELDRMLEISTRFWEYKAKGTLVHDKVIEAVTEKWGMEFQNADLIKSRFYSESSLNIIDESFWARILERAEIYQLSVDYLARTPFKNADHSVIEQLSSGSPSELNLDFSALFNMDNTIGLPSFSL